MGLHENISKFIRYNLDRACDYQGLGPGDSYLCNRAPQLLPSPDADYQRQKEKLYQTFLDPEAAARIVARFEASVEGWQRDLAAGRTQLNPCDGSVSAVRTEAGDESEVAQKVLGGADALLLGQVTAVIPGWNLDGGYLATAVQVEVIETLKGGDQPFFPKFVEGSRETVFIEPRAEFNAGKLAICSGVESSPRSHAGDLVLLAVSDWSTQKRWVQVAGVYLVKDGKLVRDLLRKGLLSSPVLLRSLQPSVDPR